MDRPTIPGDVVVADGLPLERLYARIGVSGGSHQYDTVAAQETGRTVRRELAA